MFYSAENSKRSMNISARPYDPAKGLTLEEHIRMESNRAVALSRKGMRSSLSSQSSIGSADPLSQASATKPFSDRTNLVPNMFDLEFEVQRRTEEVLKRRAEVEIRNKYIEDEVERRLRQFGDLPAIQDLSASNQMNTSPALRLVISIVFSDFCVDINS